jgi:hypothetical protein
MSARALVPHRSLMAMAAAARLALALGLIVLLWLAVRWALG